MKKIAITGTKGKTTTVNAVASVLERLGGLNVLKVDTTGHYLNGVQKSTLDDSKNIWHLVPTVCPGRYLWEFYADPKVDLDKSVAVLETALGSSSDAGLGYRAHDIGVFLNVYEDHLGSSDRLKTRADIARAKDFVFRRLYESGYAVFNADDQLVCERLSVVPKDFGIHLVPCGLEFKYFDLKVHLKAGGVAVTTKDGFIVLLTGNKTQKVANLSNIPWAFKGEFEPSVVNLLHVVGALYGYFDGKLPANFTELVEGIRLDPYGGRLTLLKAKNGTTLLLDYAHEKKSLGEVARLARSLVQGDGQVMGVVRLAHDRTDQLIKETGQVIGKAFDRLVVYDKIDGYWRKPKAQRGVKFPQITGRTSEVLTAAIQSVNPNTERIVREDLAIDQAAKITGPNDVVVVIVNDDIKRSVEFVKKSFKADFV